MRLLWLALLLFLTAPAAPPAGLGEARAPESISAIQPATDQPFLPRAGLRVLLGPLQVLYPLGMHDHPPGAPLDARLHAGTSLARPCLAPLQGDRNRFPARTCERLPYDATAPPAVG